MAHGEPPRKQMAWQQQTMFDPGLIKVELVLWLDGTLGRHQIGWSVFDGPEAELVEMEVHRTDELDLLEVKAAAVLTDLVTRHRARLAPF